MCSCANIVPLLKLLFPLLCVFSNVFAKRDHMPSQTLLDETSLAVLVSSYKIILDSYLSLHHFQHELVSPDHWGPWCCALFWKSLIQAMPHTMALVLRAFL